ncbi:MAG: hypothetical protein JW938_00730 [Candidatus Omnitrophica bacterium]|nr:hypothetical protein [Candidatus Omnitrophota bacterium]
MERILVIASSSLLANKVIADISERKNVALTVIVPTEAMKTRLHLKDTNNVMCVPGGKGFRFRAMIPYWSMINRERFNTVICLYNNKKGYGYLNVDLFALATKAKRRVAYNYDHNEIPLTMPYLFGKTIQYMSGWFWLVMNSLFIAILFIFIFFAMLFVECGMILCSIIPVKKKLL